MTDRVRVCMVFAAGAVAAVFVGLTPLWFGSDASISRLLTLGVLAMPIALLAAGIGGCFTACLKRSSILVSLLVGAVVGVFTTVLVPTLIGALLSLQSQKLDAFFAFLLGAGLTLIVLGPVSASIGALSGLIARRVVQDT